MLQGQLQEPNQIKRRPAKAKRFDSLVARHYPAVYSFACRFTDDPRKAGVLTRDAFISTRRQLRTCCDENVLLSILISNVIRAGLPVESNLTQTAQLQRIASISHKVKQKPPRGKARRLIALVG